MNRFLIFILLALLSCSKSSNEENLNRDLTVSVVAVRVTTPYISNNWEVHLQLNKAATLKGEIIVQHELWDLGQFKSTYIDTFDFKFENQNGFSFRTTRNANLQGPEIRNIKVNKFTQTAGNYIITIK